MERVGLPPNIAAAIRRSQETRAAMRSRRRRTSAAIVALCLAGAVPVSIGFANFSADDMVQAAVTKAQSLVDMLSKRSPGERTAAQLTKTKHKQRALAKMRPLARPPGLLPMAPLTDMPVELASIVMPAPPLVPPALGQIDLGPPPTLGAIVTPPGGGGAIVTPPGGGPPGITPTGPSQPPIVAPPVPEPATWVMMLLGFGLMGWRIRRSKTLLQHSLKA